MSTEGNPNLPLEIGHVLFIDIVGYSKLLIDDQRRLQEQLNQIVRNTSQFRAAEAEQKLVRLPTGDGMALVFSTNVEAPVRCALEISEALQSNPDIRTRMGINTGPVSGVTDVNDRSNIAGAGINIAQRVMDIGGTGHILLSKRAAEDLMQYREWQPHLHDIGAIDVKHGQKVSIVNFYTERLGNRELPAKLKQAQQKQHAARWRKGILIGTASALALALIGGLPFFLRQAPPRTEAAPPISEKSIAVLPFESFSDDKENAYFADGMQDDILTELSKVADIKVISRTSVMQYRGAAKNMREIARVLQVAHVLEGSVRKVANRVRVNAQLIDARTDAHLWAEQYDRDLADVFAIQSELTQRIVAQLKANLSPSEKSAIEKKPTTNMEAYDLFLRAKELANNLFRTDDPRADLLKSIEILNATISRDPNFALAYCYLSRAHLNLYWWWGHAPAHLMQAETAVKTALRLAPNLGEAHAEEAMFYYHGHRDYVRALKALDETARLLPNSARVFGLRAAIKRRVGQWDEAVRDGKKTLELDPRSEGAYDDLISSYQMLRNYSDGAQIAERGLTIIPEAANYFHLVTAKLALDEGHLQAFRAALALVPKEYAGSYLAMQAALIEHNYSEALPLVKEAMKQGFAAELAFNEAFILRKLGNASKANSNLLSARALQEKETQEKPDQAQSWADLALIDAALGRKEDALRESQKAVEILPISRDAIDGPNIALLRAEVLLLVGQRESAIELLAQLAKIPGGVTVRQLLSPRWDNIRNDPPFKRIVADAAVPSAIH